MVDANSGLLVVAAPSTEDGTEGIGSSSVWRKNPEAASSKWMSTAALHPGTKSLSEVGQLHNTHLLGVGGLSVVMRDNRDGPYQGHIRVSVDDTGIADTF